MVPMAISLRDVNEHRSLKRDFMQQNKFYFYFLRKKWTELGHTTLFTNFVSKFET